MVLIRKTNDFSKIRDIRIEIFKHLKLSKNDIFDEDDQALDQFLIIHDDKDVGSFRLREISSFYKIERMGIVPFYRSKGFGRLALNEIQMFSKNKGKSKIILDSIYDARNFYAKSGFIQTGEVYFKVGIPHVSMYLEL
ncbi:MAG: GNAT family N-acetyltransferase [Nitrosarchaeum sp.]|nr:GNAT family N-acetyltransferase [Nitrosarchaeum sp.]